MAHVISLQGAVELFLKQKCNFEMVIFSLFGRLAGQSLSTDLELLKIYEFNFGQVTPIFCVDGKATVNDCCRQRCTTVERNVQL